MEKFVLLFPHNSAIHMKLTLIFLFSLTILLTSCSNADKSLPRAAKAEIERFQTAGDKVFTDVLTGPDNVVNSLMVIDEGKVVYEKYDIGYSPDQLQVMWSVSKTFTATAIGFAEQDGLLKTSDRVVDYFDAADLPADPHPYLSELTLHDLLIMSSGWPDLAYGAIQGQIEDWTKATLASDIHFKPGDRFEYNSINGYILSVIVSKVTGRKMADYLEEKLFTPLGIKNFKWLESPQGYNAGGWGLYLSTEDFAKMGQFILQKGEWNGNQLLSREWWEKATYPHIPQYKNVITDPEEIDKLIKSRDYWSQGYAYQMWNCPDGAVRMHGANGQLGIIFPDKNAVVVVTSHVSNEKRLLDAIWNNIYPLI